MLKTINRDRRAGFRSGPPQTRAGGVRRSLFVLVVLSTILVLGGASSPSSGHAFILSLVCIPFLTYALLRRPPAALLLFDPVPAYFLLAILALIILHLVPLPPSLWTQLPGREVAVRGMELMGAEDAWLPLTLDPPAAFASALGLVPAVTLAIVTIRSGRLPSVEVGLLIVAFALLSLVMGALQVAGSHQSPLYIHAFTNWGMAVGFFANANHFSTFLLISLPVLAALLRWKLPLPEQAWVRIGTVALYGTFVVVGIFLARTVAGLLLFPMALAAALLIASARSSGWLRRSVLVLPVASIGLLLVAAYRSESGAFMTRFGAEPGGRLEIGRTTIEAAMSSWPVGSGIGSFNRVYRPFEDPDEVTNVFVNHAHNDYLEVFAETGLLGAVLILAFLAWWGLRSVQAWRDARPDAYWTQTASVVIGIILAHSLVDYPIRTPAIMALFVFYVLTLSEPRAAGTEP